MSENKPKDPSLINVTVGAGSVNNSGQYIGIAIENYYAAVKLDPPSPAEVAAYLAAIIEPGPGTKAIPSAKTDAAIRFYAAPSHIIALDIPSPERQELKKALDTTFARAYNEKRLECAVIQAEGGSGKTLALLQLRKLLADSSLPMWQAINSHPLVKPEPGAGPAEWTNQARVPILIELSGLTDEMSIERLARMAFNGLAHTQITEEQISALMPACLMMLDGLDQLPTGSGIQKVRAFMREHTQTQYVITVRIAGYHDQIGKVSLFQLDDLNQNEVKEVLGSVDYNHLSEPLRLLVRNRTLLNLIIASDKADIGLAHSKGRLVQRLIQKRLISAADGEANSIPGYRLHAEMLEGLLESLGYIFQSNRTYRLGEEKLMETICTYLEAWREQRTWWDIAKALRTSLGMLQRGADRSWGFCDRLTQAYFAAAYIARTPSLVETALQYAGDPWWYETLEMLIGLSEDSTDVMLRMIDNNPVAAARCLAFAGMVPGRQVSNTLFYALREQRSSGWGVERERTIRALSRINHPQAWQELLEAIQSDPYSMVILASVQACGESQAHNNQISLQELRRSLARRPDQQDVPGVILVWLAYGPAKAEMKERIEKHLIEVMQLPDTDPHIRGAAAITLGLIASDRTRTSLLTMFQAKISSDLLAWCVTEALAQIHHREVIDTAQKVYRDPTLNHKEWAEHRARAVYLMGAAVDKEEVAQLLFHALTSAEFAIRRRSAQVIGKLQPDGAQTRLELRLAKERNEEVIDKIAQALATLGTLETLPLLQRRLRDVERANTRRHIRDTITEIRGRYGMS